MDVRFLSVTGQLLTGFAENLKLFSATLLFSLPLGLLIALCLLSKFKPLKYLFEVIVWVIRGTPLMLQLFVVFYVPGLVFGVPMRDRFLASLIAFVINYACYFAEIYRGGIQGVPVGQQEAGQVLGMTKSQIFFKVTLLQMIKRIVPPMSNEIITLVKDTAIARIIAWQELIYAGYAFLKGSHGIAGLMWPLFFAGLYYLAFSSILTLFFGWLEKKMSYFRS